MSYTRSVKTACERRVHTQCSKAQGGTHAREQTPSAAQGGTSAGQAAIASQKPDTNVSWAAVPQCFSRVLGSPCNTGHCITRGMENWICLQNRAGGVSFH